MASCEWLFEPQQLTEPSLRRTQAWSQPTASSVAGQHAAPQVKKPGLQRHPHVPAVHVAVAFAGAAGHGVQLVPQLAGLVFERHCVEHAW